MVAFAYGKPRFHVDPMWMERLWRVGEFHFQGFTAANCRFLHYPLFLLPLVHPWGAINVAPLWNNAFSPHQFLIRNFEGGLRLLVWPLSFLYILVNQLGFPSSSISILTCSRNLPSVAWWMPFAWWGRYITSGCWLRMFNVFFKSQGASEIWRNGLQETLGESAKSGGWRDGFC